MNKKFTAAYLNMIFEDQIQRHSHFRRVSLSEFYEILNNAKIIYEMARSFKEPDKFVTEIKKCKSGTYFSWNMILNYFGKDSPYYNELINSKTKSPITIFKFNFLNKKDLKRILMNYLIDENIKNFNEVYLNFKKIVKNARGILLNFPGRYIMFLDKNEFTENTIIHELNHFIQWELNTDLIPEISEKLDYEKCKFLGLADFEVDYLLSQKEFIPHINDFCYSLKKIKNNIFSIQNVIDEIKLFCAIKDLKQCNILSQIENKESLYTVCLSYILDYHFDKVVECLKNEFN